MLKRVADSRHRSEPVSYATVEEDCPGGFAIEAFDDSNKVGTDVVFLHKAACKTLSKASLKSTKTW